MLKIELKLMTGLLALVLYAAPSLAQSDGDEQEQATHPDWVFNGKGAKTDQVAIVNLGANDAVFPINVNNNWGLMNQNGQVVLFPQYDWVDYSFDGYVRCIRDGRTGFLALGQLDKHPLASGIRRTFEYADRFNDSVAVVADEGKWGLIDVAGNFVLPLEYDGALRFQDGFAAVQRGERCGFVNRAGDLAIPLQFKAVRSFHNGFAAVQFENGIWGYIDKRGQTVWQDKAGVVGMLGDFHEQYARIMLKLPNGTQRWGYLSRRYKMHIDPIYEQARDFHNGYAAVKIKGKWGFIDGRGKWLIEPKYEDADDFDDAVATDDFKDVERDKGERTGRNLGTAGLYAMVKLDGRWGYVNRTDRAGLVPQFKQAQPFYLGLAQVSRDDSFAYVGESGQVRFDPRVAIELGFVSQTSREQARVATGVNRENLPGNEVIPAPEPRSAYKSPYPPEHEYIEMLPTPRRSGKDPGRGPAI